jgi:hypothetical protein
MPATDEHRRAHLVWAIQHILAKPGGTVQVAGPYDAVILGPGMSHGAHVLLTILFVGFWLPVWLLCAATYKRSVYHVAVDERGQLTIADATRKRPMGMAPDGTLFYA